MSLLDDVSIVVTPNGYKAGELYAVIPVPTEGAEEVTNGDFATDSDGVATSGVTNRGLEVLALIAIRILCLIKEYSWNCTTILHKWYYISGHYILIWWQGVI